jgi:hypothetical protein
MKRQKEIKLNEFQLNAWLSDEEKNGIRRWPGCVSFSIAQFPG